MSLTGLPNILHQIQSRTSWQQRGQYLLIVEKWSDIVGESVAKQTCPIGIYQESLQVAVSSGVWAQALTFERMRILQKINGLWTNMPKPVITDIHFSTAKWSTHQQTIQQQKIISTDHPSYLPAIATSGIAKRNPKPEQAVPISSPPANPNEAFQRWQSVMQQRTKHLPPCPKCDRPANEGEIARWQMCRVCAISYLFNG